MNSLKKISVFIKQYWWIPVGILLVVIFYTINRKDIVDKLVEAMKVSQKSQKEQTKVINDSIEKERELKQLNQERYDIVVEKIIVEHQVAKEELSKSRQKKIKKLIKEHQENPGQLSVALKQIYGIEYVEASD